VVLYVYSFVLFVCLFVFSWLNIMPVSSLEIVLKAEEKHTLMMVSEEMEGTWVLYNTVKPLTQTTTKPILTSALPAVEDTSVISALVGVSSLFIHPVAEPRRCLPFCSSDVMYLSRLQLRTPKSLFYHWLEVTKDKNHTTLVPRQLVVSI
jgi:hypothetical protein